MSKPEGSLFPNNKSDSGAGLISDEAAHQAAYGECPQCSSNLIIKFVGKSSFLACSAYPDCDYTHSLASLEVSVIKEIDNSHCPECDGSLAVKKGRYGMFIGCLNFPECHFISNNQSPKKTAEYSPVSCPKCKAGMLLKKQNKFGKFFYACDQYPKCKSVFNQEPIAQACEKCGGKLMLKTNKANKVVCPNTACQDQQ